MTTPGSGPAPDGLLLPWADADGAPFWEYAARGELRVQACADCGRRRFPPRPCCPHCRSFAGAWHPLGGRGRIWSFVVAHPPLLPAYAALAPYDVVLVEPVDSPGVRLAGNLVARPGGPLGEVPADRLRIGAPVRVTFARVADGVTVPRWLLERP